MQSTLDIFENNTKPAEKEAILIKKEDSDNTKPVVSNTEIIKDYSITSEKNDSEITKQEQTNYSPTNKKINNKKIRFGQFLTSNQIAEFMVGLTSINKDAKVLEPSAGKGVFLQELQLKGFSNIHAVEYDEEFFEILKENFKSINIENKDFLTTSIDDKYDLIIGNPPYVQWNNMEPHIRERLQNDSFWKNYSNGEWDIFYALIIWSIEKLNPDGELIFIIPYNWFNSTNAKSLREYFIEKGKFEIILHFGELKLFSDCFPNNIIFKFKKTQDPNIKIKVCDYFEKKANVNLLINDINNFLFTGSLDFNTEVKCFTMDNFKSPNMWFLGNSKDFELIGKIEESTKLHNEQKYVKLSDHLNVGVGMVTGFDKAFILEESQLNQYSDTEKSLIYKFVKAKNCQRFIINNPSYYLFMDHIESEEQLKAEFPNIYSTFLNYKSDLEKRYMTKNKKWWHWATVRNFELYKSNLNNEKLFVPCIDRALKARYSYTNKPFYGSGDVLMIAKEKNIQESLKYILAWLNSELINKWYRIKGSKKGQRIQYTQSYVSKIPLRLIDWNNDNEVKIYHEIIARIDKLLLNQDEIIEKEIDDLFDKLIS